MNLKNIKRLGSSITKEQVIAAILETAQVPLTAHQIAERLNEYYKGRIKKEYTSNTISPFLYLMKSQGTIKADKTITTITVYSVSLNQTN